MNADDLAGFIKAQFDQVNTRIGEMRADMAIHRKEMQDAISAANSRIDTLTHWMMTSLLMGLLAGIAAVASWFTPHKP